MTHGTGRIIKIIICDEDFFSRIIKSRKRPHLSVIRFLFRHRVCHLDEILPLPFVCDEVDFLSPVIIYIHFITHIDKLVIHHILQIMRHIIASKRLMNRIEGHIFII